MTNHTQTIPEGHVALPLHLLEGVTIFLSPGRIGPDRPAWKVTQSETDFMLTMAERTIREGLAVILADLHSKLCFERQERHGRAVFVLVSGTLPDGMSDEAFRSLGMICEHVAKQAVELTNNLATQVHA